MNCTICYDTVSTCGGRIRRVEIWTKSRRVFLHLVKYTYFHQFHLLFMFFEFPQTMYI
jgi:hypothetical protein